MDSEQVEIVARAIAVTRGDDPSELLLNLETGATDQPLWECYLPEARAAILAYRPLVIEEAWRDGFQCARDCLTEDEAFCLTEDVEQDVWLDSKSATALRSIEGTG